MLKEQLKKILSKKIILLELILLFVIAVASIYLVNTLKVLKSDTSPYEAGVSKNAVVVIPTMSRLTNEDYKNLLTDSYDVLIRISKLMDSESEYYLKKEVSDTDKLKIIEILGNIDSTRNSYNNALTLFNSKIGLSKDSKTFYYFDENDSLLKTSIDNVSKAIKNASYANTSLIRYYETNNEGELTLANSNYGRAYKSIKELQAEIRKILVGNTSEIYVSDIEKPKNSQTDPGLQSYYDTYEDPFVIQIRTTLNSYLKDPKMLSETVLEGLGDGKSGLNSYSSEYFKGRFVVMDIKNGLAGGKEINIIFPDKPDKVFWVWVYVTTDGVYEMRGFQVNSIYTEDKIQYFLKQYQNLIQDISHSL
ncbi:MAG TPA: hypothetical protein VI911_06800 [Patescibacteria group bacterium]|uniref:Uncharacterized protein n=2 Tax=Katanobacteria TaxID=422282 RepID=A0A0G0Y1C5_UNCKA|nr:MAG: hypothetical protein UR43_C0017G0005 [candidate division TM6 bacterium GW2011_GWF2_33_332]KKS03216.1 MAG: hypothetical protein UU55_C0004G0005 [candidate division WWE3 bacterium GW2011_GWC2_41_23]OGC59202.1 MAG: hypothetical protein A2245_00365 [candidate division WWE3 bacterium RIFOXYA2_FULL_43_12]HBY09772.1 hypothetical protein [candidate division WWE3 bacterium]HLD90703.1 hypothetical protein [Patescibacteria group bacterium]